MQQEELVISINKNFSLSLPEKISLEELREKLGKEVNRLINEDFHLLVFHLYRIDVNEDRMRDLLASKEGEDAASLIADLIIERQLQKIKTRRESGRRDNDISEEEKW